MSKNFNEVCEKIVKNSNNNITLSETALHLFNCYIIDTYPSFIYEVGTDKLAKSFIFIAELYLGQTPSNNDEEIKNIATKIKKIIESTPEIRL